MATQTKNKTKTKAQAGADMREHQEGANALSVPGGGPRLTAAQQRQREEALEIKHLVADRIARIEAQMENIQPFLDMVGITPALFLASLRLAMAKNPKIARCTPVSLILSCMDIARVGLSPDGKKAAIVPFNGIATTVIMYQGYLDIIYRTGLIASATCQVVYEGEEEFLDFDLGSNTVSFKPPLSGRDDSRKIAGAYAHAVAKDGVGAWVEVCGPQELKKAAKVNKFDDVRKAWPGEMDRKTPLRRMIKFLPSHPLLDAANSIEAKTWRKALPEKEEAPRLSDEELLNDNAASTPRLDAPEPEDDDDDETALMAPVDRFTNMLATAEDGEMLEARASLIVSTAEYDALDAVERGLVEMTLRQQREAFGIDPDAHIEDAVVEEVDEEPIKTKAAVTLVEHKTGNPLIIETGAEFQAYMLETMAKGDATSLHHWWEANLKAVGAAASLWPKQTDRVVLIAQDKGLHPK